MYILQFGTNRTIANNIVRVRTIYNAHGLIFDRDALLEIDILRRPATAEIMHILGSWVRL